MKTLKYTLAMILSLTLLNQSIGCTAYTHVNSTNWKAAASGGYYRMMLADRRSFQLNPSRPVSVQRLTRVLTGTVVLGRRPVVLCVDSLVFKGAVAVRAIRLHEIGRSSFMAVVMAGGNVVSFSPSGGWYDPDQQVVIGTSETGKAIRLQAASIESVLIEERAAWTLESLKDTTLRLRRVTTVNGMEYIFEGKGAMYHDSVDALAGTLGEGHELLIPVSEVQSLGKTDGGRTGLLIVIAMVSLVLAVVIVQSELDAAFGGLPGQDE